MATYRKQPPREVLLAHSKRAKETQQRNPRMEPASSGHRQNPRGVVRNANGVGPKNSAWASVALPKAPGRTRAVRGNRRLCRDGRSGKNEARSEPRRSVTRGSAG